MFQPESTETTSEREFQTTAVQTDLPIESTVVPTPITSNPVLDLLKKRLKSPAHLSHLAKKNDEEKEDRRALSERALAQLHAQVTQLKGDFSKLEDKYQALEHERDMLVTDKKMSANDIEAKQTQVDELMQLLDLERSKHPIAAAEPKEMPAGELDPSPHQDDSELQNRVKMLEDNVAQMNAYADQLEMVIAQCPSCTNKLQNGSTQDFAAEDKAE
ncbi:hypothetical protein PHYBOEH_007508 [Phytophthora boehmeriae]|uniref:Uncharacterized protein n=1 Tax=Phytophthora boehmeriae TaxID=109152 RepID=A0A8T1WCQ1_9STRA|nr:hypothetical protein PHYBOEH_007508 [Phytophthora boehmeriae]